MTPWVQLFQITQFSVFILTLWWWGSTVVIIKPFWCTNFLNFYEFFNFLFFSCFPLFSAQKQFILPFSFHFDGFNYLSYFIMERKNRFLIPKSKFGFRLFKFQIIADGVKHLNFTPMCNIVNKTVTLAREIKKRSIMKTLLENDKK